MRNLMLFGLGLSLMVAPVLAEEVSTEVVAEQTVIHSHADESSEVATPARVVENPKLPVALIAYGDVDAALVERVQRWAEANLALPVPVLSQNITLQLPTFDDVSVHAEREVEANRFGVVVLWRPSSDVKNHGAFFPDKRVSIINLGAMFTDETDAEVIERRVERQVIRGICFVMGLEPNPNPQSAMFDYSTLEELDAIGRNLDPPWLVRLQEKALEAGVPIDVENPYNMVLP